MDAIRIQNLRSLWDTGFVDIRPITILVGQNNSGKSTFLRTFPLLRQSVESRTSGPILWFGRLVDFGSHDEAVFRRSQEKSVTMHFHIAGMAGPQKTSWMFGAARTLFSEEVDATISLQVATSAKGENFVAAVDLALADHRIQVTFDVDSLFQRLVINASDFSSDISMFGNRYKYGSRHRYGLVPRLEILEEPGRDRPSPLRKQLFAEIRKHVHPSTHDETVQSFVDSLGVASSTTMLSQMQTSSQATDSWKRRTQDWSTSNEDFQRIRDLAVAVRLPAILAVCDDYVGSLARNVSYIAPVRTTAERYARVQNLAVDEVDYQGTNLTVFLRSLSEADSRQFRDWTERFFGFSTYARAGGAGHISLRIREEGSDDEINIADKGFGYSQILPILAQLWLLTYRRSGRGNPLPRISGVPTIFAIEQPELHLHPQLQARLMDAFVDAVKPTRDRKRRLRLVLETHSEILVNRLGHHVAHGNIDPNDVSVVVFEKARPDAPTSLRIGGFDRDGFLTNWPVGFFEPNWT